LKLDFRVTAGIIALLAAGFAFFTFGFTGVKVFLGIALMGVPFYLFLRRFKLPEGEKIVFSLFLGLGITPLIVYWLGVVMSFRAAVIIGIIGMILLSLIKYNAKNNKEQGKQEGVIADVQSEET